MGKRQKGFSLIELLIVVAIILIIAAIAIPNLLRARMAANESSAVGTLRTLNWGQAEYLRTCATQGYASTLALLGPAAAPSCTAGENLVDNILGTANTFNKSGYTFTFAPVGSGTPLTGYTVNANPLVPSSTGINYFCTDQTTWVHVNPSAQASCTTDPILQ